MDMQSTDLATCTNQKNITLIRSTKSEELKPMYMQFHTRSVRKKVPQNLTTTLYLHSYLVDSRR